MQRYKDCINWKWMVALWHNETVPGISKKKMIDIHSKMHDFHVVKLYHVT